MLISPRERDAYKISSMFDVSTSTAEHRVREKKAIYLQKKDLHKQLPKQRGEKEAAERLEMQHKLRGNIWLEKG